MTEFKDIGQGWKKEVVSEVEVGAVGTKVPNAFEDSFGGRPGLTGATILPPPIDDPPMDGEPVRQAVASPVQPASAPDPAASRSEPSCAQAVPRALPPLPTSGRPAREAPVGDQPSAPATTTPVAVPGPAVVSTPPVDATALAAALSDPNVAATLRAALSPDREDERKSPGEESAKLFVLVVLEGGFGRFRSKATDVIICEKHIALLYTAGVGDGDLAYEPPMDQTFKLKVPMDDSSFKEFTVRHFGLTTVIPGVGTLVVLPRADEQPEAVEHDEQEERG
jgi:hypothetical protein